MTAWLLLLATTAETLMLAAVATYSGGLAWGVVACLVGGWCMAQRDSNYQQVQRGRATRMEAGRGSD